MSKISFRRARARDSNPLRIRPGQSESRVEIANRSVYTLTHTHTETLAQRVGESSGRAEVGEGVGSNPGSLGRS